MTTALKYLVVQLSDDSISFCHYSNKQINAGLIDLHVLENGLIWAIKNGLKIQILYPDHIIPNQYINLIDRFEHIDIKPETLASGDVIVLSNWNSIISRVY